jgi:hypothetical protein
VPDLGLLLCRSKGDGSTTRTPGGDQGRACSFERLKSPKPLRGVTAESTVPPTTVPYGSRFVAAIQQSQTSAQTLE